MKRQKGGETATEERGGCRHSGPFAMRESVSRDGREKERGSWKAEKPGRCVTTHVRQQNQTASKAARARATEIRSQRRGGRRAHRQRGAAKTRTTGTEEDTKLAWSERACSAAADQKTLACSWKRQIEKSNRERDAHARTNTANLSPEPRRLLSVHWCPGRRRERGRKHAKATKKKQKNGTRPDAVQSTCANG